MALKIIVTGQPRTGTSFLTSLVAKMSGYSLGPKGGLKKQDRHNPNGYFESVDIMQIEDALLQKLGGSYQKIPDKKSNWHKECDGIKAILRGTINRDKIEIIKSPRGIMIGDIYYDMYPKAVWFYTKREPEVTYKSRWGKRISLKKWKKICAEREIVWRKSKVSRRVWNVNYENFETNFKGEWLRIIRAFRSEGIKINCSFEECEALWKPRRK